MDIHQSWSILGASLICWGILATPAAAELRRIDDTIRSEPEQTFETLMQQAESLATDLVNQGFAEDNVTEVSVHILGERHGQQVPLLFSRVSRADWQKHTGIRQWTRYFRASGVLLGFFKPEQPNQTPLSAFPNPNSDQSVPNQTSGNDSAPQTAPSPEIQQSVPNSGIDGSVPQTAPSPEIQQPLTPQPIPSPEIQQPIPLNSSPQLVPPAQTTPNTPLRGASPDESDPGYR